MARLARPLYAALSFDGDVDLLPPLPMTPASSPPSTGTSSPTKGSGRRSVQAAAEIAARADFAAEALHVLASRSDWMLEPADEAIQS